MRTIVRLLIALSILSWPVHAQDGELLGQNEYQFSEETISTLEVDGSRLRDVMASVSVSEITYRSDGLEVKGLLVQPKRAGRYPAIIANRGGNREFGAWNELRVAGTLVRMASWGYVVVASQYRGVNGGQGVEEFGGADVNDVLNLIPLLDSLPNVDDSRIGMWGWSRGGMMSYIALTRTDRIKGAVIGAGPTDLEFGARERSEMELYVYRELMPNYDSNREELLFERSAVWWPEKIHKNTPILLLHGTADWRVSPEDSIRIASLFYRHKQPFRLVLFEGGDHGLTQHRPETLRLTKEWFDKYVRDGELWPSLEATRQ